MIDKRERILQEAEELFSENGFEGTSIRDIAAKADVNLAMISYYFGSKEKLFEEMVIKRTSYIRDLIQQLNENEPDPWKRIYALIDSYVDRILSNTGFHKILYREMSLEIRSEMNARICQILSGNSVEYMKIITAGIEQKVFKEVDVPLTIASIIGTINHSILSPKVVCKVIGADPEKYSISSEQHKTRLKIHLKSLITDHLQIRN